MTIWESFCDYEERKAKSTQVIPSDNHEALFGAIMFYSTSCYQRFNQLTKEQCQEAADAASEASEHGPLWMRNAKTGKIDECYIPHFGWKSSVYCMAIMSAWIVWLQKKIAGNPLPDSPLLSAATSGLILFTEELSDYWNGNK